MPAPIWIACMRVSLGTECVEPREETGPTAPTIKATAPSTHSARRIVTARKDCMRFNEITDLSNAQAKLRGQESKKPDARQHRDSFSVR